MKFIVREAPLDLLAFPFAILGVALMLAGFPFASEEAGGAGVWVLFAPLGVMVLRQIHERWREMNKKHRQRES